MFPKLVINPKTEARVIIDDNEPNEFGEREPLLDKVFLCNYQDTANVVYTKDRQQINANGTIYIDGDVAPNVPFISNGKVVIFGETHEIIRGQKARNFDGTVNFTRLDVI